MDTSFFVHVGLWWVAFFENIKAVEFYSTDIQSSLLRLLFSVHIKKNMSTNKNKDIRRNIKNPGSRERNISSMGQFKNAGWNVCDKYLAFFIPVCLRWIGEIYEARNAFTCEFFCCCLDIERKSLW